MREVGSTGPANDSRAIATREEQSISVPWMDGEGPDANDRSKMASQKRDGCERRRAAADAPGLISVEDADSAPIARGLGSASMGGTASARTNGRPGAALSPTARPRTDLRGQVSCTNTSFVLPKSPFCHYPDS